MTVQISFSNVSKIYSRGPERVTAIDDLSFEISSGEFIGYAGPNGAGKSTSLKAMTGVLSVTSGEVRVRGVDPLKNRQRLARHIGAVLGQRNQMIWELSPADFYEMIRAMYRMSPAIWKERLEHLIDILDLQSFINQPVRSLSLGQRMRAELTAALLPQPEILFLDEPTIGLDLEAKTAMRDALRNLNREEGTTVVLTTHDLTDIEALCSRLMIIDHGKLTYDGSIGNLFESYSPARTIEFQLADHQDADLEFEPSWKVEESLPVVKVTFDRQLATAKTVIQRVLDQVEVSDLRIIEPKIEDVIRTIYRSSRSSSR